MRMVLGRAMELVEDEDHGPYQLVVPFTCVCARMHLLDREKVLEVAERLIPQRASAPARRVDFRTVARVVWENDPTP